MFSIGVCVILVLTALMYLYFLIYNFVILSEITSTSIKFSDDDMQFVLNMQLKNITNEMSDFDYPDGKSLSDFILPNNGTPYRTLIITSWRSGSSFTGEILNSLPGSYYFYEPLSLFGQTKQISTESPESEIAIKYLKNLFKCDHTEDFIDMAFNLTTCDMCTVKRNRRLWNYCNPKKSKNYCTNSNFLSNFCKLFPIQLMKLCRMRLHLAEEILNDASLNVKVIYLVRDPRGTISSRLSIDWCFKDKECYHPKNLCSNLVLDYDAAVNLKQKYPDRFSVLRYEELALNPVNKTKEILDFLKLPFHPFVEKFLNDSTISNNGSFYAVTRNSKSTPFVWVEKLKTKRIKFIEENCRKALSVWGYQRVDDNEKFRDGTFDPVLPFQIPGFQESYKINLI